MPYGPQSKTYSRPSHHRHLQPTVSLLVLAEQILDGVVPVPGGRAPRAAAVVARQALEEEITARCAKLVTFVQRPRMRSRLILLRHDDREIGRVAQIAWAQRSSASPFL